MARRDRPGRFPRRRAARRNEAFNNVTVRDIVLQRNKLKADVTEAIIAANFTQSVKEISHIELTIHDQARVLLRHDILTKKMRFTLDGREYVTVARSKSQNDFTVTAESRTVNKLKQFDSYKAVRRGKATRAEFFKMLCDEARVDFFCPELKDRQPIERASDQESKDRKERERRPGIGSLRNLNIVTGDGGPENTHPATPAQADIIERCLEVADSRNVLPRAALALVEAVMIESGATNKTQASADRYGSYGILQARVGVSNGIHGTVTMEQALDVEYMAASFLEDSPSGGFTSKGGAQYLAKAHPDWTAGEIAATVEGPAEQYRGRYDRAREEAIKWLEAFDGGSLGSVTSYTKTKPYIFSRGEKGGDRENSWQCMRRLADEVRWYLFEHGDTIYFMSGDYLRKSKPFLTLKETDPGVDWINWSNDEGGQIDTATVELNTPARWTVPPGAAIELDEQGELVDGIWIVTSITGDLFETRRVVEIERPVKRAPEPANETEERSATFGGSGGGTGTLRERIVSIAELSVESYQSNPGAWFYSQSGSAVNQDPTRPPRPGTRSDCSSWVCDVYKAAGAPQPPGSSWTGWTGSMQETGRSVSLDNIKPGDLILYGAGSATHVELYVGPGDRTIGHGSPPVDEGTIHMKAGARGWTYGFLDE